MLNLNVWWKTTTACGKTIQLFPSNAAYNCGGQYALTRKNVTGKPVYKHATAENTYIFYSNRSNDGWVCGNLDQLAKPHTLIRSKYQYEWEFYKYFVICEFALPVARPSPLLEKVLYEMLIMYLLH